MAEAQAKPADFAEGLVVERVEEPGQHGEVIQREGQRVRVDFSASGGKVSGWWSYKELRVVDALVTRLHEKQGGVEGSGRGRKAETRGLGAKRRRGFRAGKQGGDEAQAKWCAVTMLSLCCHASIISWHGSGWLAECGSKAQARRKQGASRRT